MAPFISRVHPTGRISSAAPKVGRCSPPPVPLAGRKQGILPQERPCARRSKYAERRWKKIVIAFRKKHLRASIRCMHLHYNEPLQILTRRRSRTHAVKRPTDANGGGRRPPAVNPDLRNTVPRTETHRTKHSPDRCCKKRQLFALFMRSSGTPKLRLSRRQIGTRCQ